MVKGRKAETMDANIEKKILDCIGQKVHFKYPVGEDPRSGILKDRVTMQSNATPEEVIPYWNVVDRIKFDKDQSSWIRFGYYRLSKGVLRWASQTTLCDREDTWVELMVKAAKEKPWFRDLLVKVVKRANIKIDL